MGQRRVVITGLGCISPVGNNVADMWNAVTSGKSGIGPITRFDASAFSTTFAGEVKNFQLEDYIMEWQQVFRQLKTVVWS